MAINMARLSGSSVVNIESWDNETPESANLKFIGDKPVAIGDLYQNGRYYRGADEVLSPAEAENQILLAALADVAEALYEADLASIDE